nr:MAG TPA: hypothetical protein [Caudoviricetes sp.]
MASRHEREEKISNCEKPLKLINQLLLATKVKIIMRCNMVNA